MRELYRCDVNEKLWIVHLSIGGNFSHHVIDPFAQYRIHISNDVFVFPPSMYDFLICLTFYYAYVLLNVLIDM